MQVVGAASTSPSPMTKRQKLDLLWSQLDSEFNTFKPLYRDLNDYILPTRARFFLSDVNRGDRRNLKILDSTATNAARTLRAGMVSGVTSPARPWFKLETPDALLNRMPRIRQWLYDVTDIMNKAFTRSNYYQTKPIVYGDLGTFGTAAYSMVKDFENVIHTHPFPIGSYRIAKDSKGRVNVFAREYRMTVSQLIEEFGELDPKTGKPDWSNFSHHVKQQYDQGLYQTWIDVRHIVKPNGDYNPESALSKHKKYMSCYYETGSSSAQTSAYLNPNDDIYLSEKGFDNFPILAPRWEVAGEDVYGTECPGITCIGDVKQLQWGEKRIAQAIDHVIKPPMKGPASLRNQKTSILPGDMTFSDEREGQRGFTPVYQIDPRINEMEMKQGQVRERINDTYYVNLMLMMTNSDRREITAREIEERHEEKLLALGPVMEQINQDDLDPSIDLLFNYLLELNMLPPPPEELQGMKLNVVYISMMAQAQKMIGIGMTERFAQFAGQLIAPFPQAAKKININRMLDHYGDQLSLMPGIVRSDEEVAELEQAEAQMVERQQKMEMLATGAKAAKDLSGASMEGDSALRRMIDSAQNSQTGGVPV